MNFRNEKRDQHCLMSTSCWEEQDPGQNESPLPPNIGSSDVLNAVDVRVRLTWPLAVGRWSCGADLAGEIRFSKNSGKRQPEFRQGYV